MYVVSACLCGVNCKYSGENNYNEKVYELFAKGEAIPICPEQLGGLETPRLAAEITCGSAKDILLGEGKIQNKEGLEVTKQFVKGAEESLKIAKATGCKTAILKARSPSCGHGKIYDGSFEGKLTGGNGVTAELFEQHGITVLSEDEI